MFCHTARATLDAFHTFMKDNFSIQPHMWELYEDEAFDNSPERTHFLEHSVIVQAQEHTEVPLVCCYDHEFSFDAKRALRTPLNRKRLLRNINPDGSPAISASMATGRHITEKQAREKEAILGYVRLKNAAREARGMAIPSESAQLTFSPRQTTRAPKA